MAAIQDITDMMGRPLRLAVPAQRIVSLVPSQTELLYDLGLEDEVVGITKFCVHPNVWFRDKARVGGTKTVDIENVKALAPDLIIANKEENVEDKINALSSIAPVWVSDIQDLPSALEMILQIGELVGKAEKANEIATKITNGFAGLSNLGQGRTVAYGIWRNPWMWAGGDTFIHDLLQRLGYRNVFENKMRYPEADLITLAKLKPDVVLLSSEPFFFKEKHIQEVQSLLPNAKVQLVDGEMYSWYGSRLVEAVGYFGGGSSF